MAELPTVSIVTPSYNHAPYIESTVRSVLDQHYPKLEYVVMDGGSKDGTVEILRRLYDQSAGAFSWVSEPDSGQSSAVNQGFAKTTGEILGWVNSDDRLKPGAIDTAVRYLADHPEIACVYGDADFILADGSYLCACANLEPFNRRRLLHYTDFIVQPAAFFRRSAFDAVGGLDATLNFAMDYDLFLKMAMKFEFAYLPQTWAEYRWLGVNKSALGSWRRLEEVRRVTQRHGARRLPAYFQLEVVNLYVQAAKEQWKQHRPAAAIGQIARAAANAITSPVALACLLDPRTRRVINTGKILRASV
ncbi:glycosyltransferase family 2 protein [soil metagenome]